MLDIQQLLPAKDDSKRQITSGATDYGLVAMSKTSALTLSEASRMQIAMQFSTVHCLHHDQIFSRSFNFLHLLTVILGHFRSGE